MRGMGLPQVQRKPLAPAGRPASGNVKARNLDGKQALPTDVGDRIDEPTDALGVKGL